MTRRGRRIVRLAALAVFLGIALAVLFPHPSVWSQPFEDAAYPAAVWNAWWFARGLERPSGTWLNGVTYTFLVESAGKDEIRVVFLGRELLKPATKPEEIHVFVSRSSGRVERWMFHD
ncbi:MAG: hypothetical protein JOZ54_17915 [Acidobacteria bacterium]|nr:hypothetical protein [Acidobacteriota bacterium]